MKKGLGSIPKSLAWLDRQEDVAPAGTVQQERKQVVFNEPVVQELEQKNQASVVVDQPAHTSFSFDEKIHSTASKEKASGKPKSTQQGLPDGWTRATFIVNQQLNEKIKALAYWERVTVKEIVHEALTNYLQDRTVRAIPKRDGALKKI